MKMGFYSKIALSNLQKNRQFFIPHILTGAGLMASFYIILTLAMDGRLASIRGGNYISSFMFFGIFIMVFLSTILLLYTNSFLMKQRKREFGLYNVLGMEKRHVCRVLFYESLFSNGLAILAGLLTGILFYKLCSLAICRLLNAEIVLGFYYINPMSIIPAVLLFLGLYVLTFLINVVQIGRMKPVELLASNHVGEREPKVRWILLIVGILALGRGYMIAVTTDNPFAAITSFFVAVLLVILGTYCLYMAGSIWILKMLKNNEQYYYQKNHMTSVSGLLYRMKQNAVGLASITILATCVLVMLSTTFSLYSGIQETLKQKFPQQLYISVNYDTETEENIPVGRDVIEDILRRQAGKYGLEVTEIYEETSLDVTFLLKNGVLSADQTDFDLNEMGNLLDMLIIPLDEYNTMAGENLTLEDGEIALCPFTSDSDIADTELVLECTDQTYRIKEKLVYFPLNGGDLATVIRTCGVVMTEHDLNWLYEKQLEWYGDNASYYCTDFAVAYNDIHRLLDVGEEMYDGVRADIRDYVNQQPGATGGYSDAYWDTRDYVYGMYGSLLFLGILLGLVFLFATALIIYYKQISEGYEDRSRFQIMEKIGMSASEVRRTIYRQIIMVFILPLIIAGIHMGFAFPILLKILRVLLLPSVWIFVKGTIGVYVIFALIYIGIYLATARTYYRIVH